MRFKVDENLPDACVDWLADLGHEADTVADEDLVAAPDEVLIAACRREGRLILTLDRGMGDIRRFPPGTHTGIFVLRPTSQEPTAVKALLTRALVGLDLPDLLSCNVVVEEDRIRIQRPPPEGASGVGGEAEESGR